MTLVLLGAGVLLVFLLIGQGFLSASPQVLARQLKRAAGYGLLIAAAFMLATGRWIAAIPLASFGVSMLGWSGIGLPQFGLGSFGSFGAKKASGRRSTVRSAALEMDLDHDSGIMSGRVLAGSFEGQELARLSIEQLIQLWREVRADPESRSLLEAYLDRRQPVWRENVEGYTAAGQGSPPGSGGMSEQEAYQVLGLQAGAGEPEIREAHRRLMKAVHPDRGGSTFLASKINEAKDRLLGKHRTNSNY